MDLSVVIPNYNGAKYIINCISCIYEQVSNKRNIVIIDNHSIDDSVVLIKESFPDITVIVSKENIGFAAAVNIGIKHCDTEYVILLNNDAFAKAGFVRSLYESIRNDQRIFSASSKMLSFADPEIIDDAGDQINLLGWSFKTGEGNPSEKHHATKVIFSSCAGAAIYRKKIFEEIGYFDERFFAYLEDVDIGFRANIFGYINIYCPKAEALHIGSATSGSVKYSAFKVRISSRNNVYLMAKNIPLLLLLIHIPLFLIGAMIKLLFFTTIGFGKLYLHGLFDGIKTIRSVGRVKFKLRNIKNYIRVEYLMLYSTIYYFGVRVLKVLKPTR